MPSTPLKAFVSSTYEDLKDHRAHVIKVLRKSGIFVDPMEDWTADSDEPKKFSQERLSGCNFCVLLVALRRGFVPNGEQRSITQMEYQAALDKKIDVLPFLLDDDAPWPHRFVKIDKGLKQWRKSLKEIHGVGFFGLEPSSIDIAPAIIRWEQKQFSNKVGETWILLVSELLGLPKSEPETWKIAEDLLPHALDAVQNVYLGLLSPKPTKKAGKTTEQEMSKPIKTLLAGTHEYFNDTKAKYERTCFIIMPFGKKKVGEHEIDFNFIYDQIFCPAVAQVPLPEGGFLEPRRTDENFFSGDISIEMFSYIEYSRFALADISGLNANVFYELGVRHRAHQAGTALFRLIGEAIPFEFNNIRIFDYDYHPETEIAKSRALIVRVLTEFLKYNRLDNSYGSTADT